MEVLTAPNLAAFVLFSSLTIYVLTGGADFGGGLWSLGSRLRGDRQTAEAAERAIGPIWEANHVWLILAIVVLFVCFSPVFALITTALHVPLTLALVGIVLRGSGYVFGAYGLGRDDEASIWRTIFGAASLVTPIVLGIAVGALATGQVQPPQPDQSFVNAYIWPWLELFPVLCGFFTLAIFAYLAAVYLALDSDTEGAREMYRLYGISSGIGLGVGALVTAVAIPQTPFGDRLVSGLFGSWWSVPLHVATGTAAIAAIYWLYRRNYVAARIAAIVQVTLILTGWAAAQYPYLVPKLYTIEQAASEAAVLVPALIAIAIGSVVVVPAMWYLYKIFKADTFRGDNA